MFTSTSTKPGRFTLKCFLKYFLLYHQFFTPPTGEVESTSGNSVCLSVITSTFPVWGPSNNRRIMLDTTHYASLEWHQQRQWQRHTKRQIQRQRQRQWQIKMLKRPITCYIFKKKGGQGYHLYLLFLLHNIIDIYSSEDRGNFISLLAPPGALYVTR